jgi:hypothetical protein
MTLNVRIGRGQSEITSIWALRGPLAGKCSMIVISALMMARFRRVPAVRGPRSISPDGNGNPETRNINPLRGPSPPRLVAAVVQYRAGRDPAVISAGCC